MGPVQDLKTESAEAVFKKEKQGNKLHILLMIFMTLLTLLLMLC